MAMGRNRQKEVIAEAVSAARNHKGDDPAFIWLIRLYDVFPGDIGCLSPLFLNLIELKPGEALYLPAGELHAYLAGAGMELMANSDNVLRGGLTQKHIDLPELLNVLKFYESSVNIIRPGKNDRGERVYRTEAREMLLSQISIFPDFFYKSPSRRSIEIIICMEGETRIFDLDGEECLPLKRGTSVMVPAAVNQYRIEGEGLLYKASVPL
jgi:mannose-6-phosphate isomerase